LRFKNNYVEMLCSKDKRWFRGFIKRVS